MNNHNTSPQVFKVKTQFEWATLPLVVDSVGSRWISLGLISHSLGLSLGNYTLPRTEKPSFGRRRVCGQECLPIDRCPKFFASIKEGSVPAPARPFLFWARQHAFRAMADFTVPVPVVPMLEVEPEPAPVPMVAAPKVETGLQTFNFGVLPVRVVMRENDPWWVAADVCSVLDLGNPTQALTRLDEDEQSTLISNEGGPGRRIVSESGLYSLVIGSRKPEAKAFKRWITHEVIPSIRKTGGYGVAQRDPMQILNDPAALRNLLSGYTEKVLTLECKVSEQAEAIECKDGVINTLITTTAGAHTLTESAKLLQQPPRKFMKELERIEWIYRTNGRYAAYQPKIHQGLMEHKFVVVQHDDGPIQNVAQPLITAKGIAKLAEMFGQAS